MDKYRKCFAEYEGYEIVEIGYFSTKSETKWQKENEDYMDIVGIVDVGWYAVNKDANKWHYVEDLAYTTSWDWLLPVWKKASCEIYGQKELMAKCMANIFDVDIEKAYKNIYELIKAK